MPRRASARVSSGRPGLPNGVGLRSDAGHAHGAPGAPSAGDRLAGRGRPTESRTPPRVATPVSPWNRLSIDGVHGDNTQRHRHERRTARASSRRTPSSTTGASRASGAARRTTRAEAGDTRHARRGAKRDAREDACQTATRPHPAAHSSAKKPRAASSARARRPPRAERQPAVRVIGEQDAGGRSGEEEGRRQTAARRTHGDRECKGGDGDAGDGLPRTFTRAEGTMRSRTINRFFSGKTCVPPFLRC